MVSKRRIIISTIFLSVLSVTMLRADSNSGKAEETPDQSINIKLKGGANVELSRLLLENILNGLNGNSKFTVSCEASSVAKKKEVLSKVCRCENIIKANRQNLVLIINYSDGTNEKTVLGEYTDSKWNSFQNGLPVCEEMLRTHPQCL